MYKDEGRRKTHFVVSAYVVSAYVFSVFWIFVIIEIKPWPMI
jgi:hypothetical protein